MHKFALNKSRMSSLSSNSRLNFKHQFEQINHNLQSKGQLRSKILFQLITYLMGVVTIALILQLNANVQQYLTYLNDNQYLLSINSEFGSPVYSGYGVVRTRTSHLPRASMHSARAPARTLARTSAYATACARCALTLLLPWPA